MPGMCLHVLLRENDFGHWTCCGATTPWFNLSALKTFLLLPINGSIAGCSFYLAETSKPLHSRVWRLIPLGIFWLKPRLVFVLSSWHENSRSRRHDFTRISVGNLVASTLRNTVTCWFVVQNATKNTVKQPQFYRDWQHDGVISFTSSCHFFHHLTKM